MMAGSLKAPKYPTSCNDFSSLFDFYNEPSWPVLFIVWTGGYYYFSVRRVIWHIYIVLGAGLTGTGANYFFFMAIFSSPLFLFAFLVFLVGWEESGCWDLQETG